jgi:sugar phosphate isomerase/epimerase
VLIFILQNGYIQKLDDVIQGVKSMGFLRGVVLTSIWPAAVSSYEEFIWILSYFSRFGIGCFEFWSLLGDIEPRVSAIKNIGGRAIYLLAARQKSEILNLCAINPVERKYAVNQTINHLEAARRAKVDAVLITSGKIQNGKDEDALSALEESLIDIDLWANKTQCEMTMSIEPGDRDIDACQLIGSTKLAVAMVERLRNKGVVFSLTMDTSHIAQLGEKPEDSFEIAKPFSQHIHLANCVLNGDSPLYGDKHPLFDCDNGFFSSSDLKNIYEQVRYLYRVENLVVSVEIINRADDKANFLYEAQEQMEWFLQQSKDE